MHTIYTITNELTGKCYVGQTRKPLHQRLQQHFYEARNGRHRRMMPIIRAIQKYGQKNFTIAPVADCQTVEEANEREKLFIIVLRATDPLYGYNVSAGGFNHDHLRGQKRTRESRLRMKLAAKPGVPRATHCPKGHPYEGENLIVTTRGDGRKHRACRVCTQERDRNRDRVRNKGVGRGGVNKTKTHCKREHEFTAENTIAVNGGLGRKCRACELLLRNKQRREVTY